MTKTHLLCGFILTLLILSSPTTAQVITPSGTNINQSEPSLGMPLSSSAQPDSMNAYRSKPLLFRSIANSRLYQMTYIGTPLILAGIVTRNFDEHVHDIRSVYAPRFSDHFDDALQYSPGLLLLGLKTAGVEGRSSWGRMLVSDAFAAGIMALSVNGVKYSARRMRPDGTARNSFPSGHTATSFMLATMLHKEYGTTRSPLYSILGYSLATATALGRQLNNRHWFSDVLAGAGIGIVSTNVGYYLADLIFKKRGLLRQPAVWEPFETQQKYATLGIRVGYELTSNEVHLPQAIKLSGKGGAGMAVTGAWFFNPHWGVEGRFGVSQAFPDLHTEHFLKNNPQVEKEVEYLEIPPLSYYNLLAGLQYQTRLTEKILVGGSLLGGIGHLKTHQIDVKYEDIEDQLSLMKTSAKPIPNIELTAHCTNIISNNLALKLFISHNIGKVNSRYTYHPLDVKQKDTPIHGTNRFYSHHLSIGVEVCALIF